MDWEPKMILSTLTAAGGVVVMLWQGGLYVDNHFAHQEDLVWVEMRLDQKVQADRIYQLREEVYQIERQYPGGPAAAPESVQERYKRLKAELDDALRERDQLQEQMRQRRK